MSQNSSCSVSLILARKLRDVSKFESFCLESLFLFLVGVSLSRSNVKKTVVCHFRHTLLPLMLIRIGIQNSKSDLYQLKIKLTFVNYKLLHDIQTLFKTKVDAFSTEIRKIMITIVFFSPQAMGSINPNTRFNLNLELVQS